MRYAMLIFALLGTAGSGFLGYAWYKNTKTLDEMSQKLGGDDKVEMLMKLTGDKGPGVALTRARTVPSYVLLAGAVVGLLAAVATFARVIPGVVGGVVLLAFAVVPAVLVKEPAPVMFTIGFLLAGLFAFFVRARPAVRPLDPDAAPVSDLG